MGMYTELHFNVQLKEDTPKNIINALNHMLSLSEHGRLPDHPLFTNKGTGFRSMLICDSYYFEADSHSTLRFDEIANAYYLCIRSNFKNYDDEVSLFLDWIMPYVDVNSDMAELLGFYRYEEDSLPTLIYREGIIDLQPASWDLKASMVLGQPVMRGDRQQ